MDIVHPTMSKEDAEEYFGARKDAKRFAHARVAVSRGTILARYDVKSGGAIDGEP